MSKNPTSKIQRLKSRTDRVVGPVLVALMGLSVVNVLWGVFTRFVMGSPSSFTTELARFMLIWIGVLGAGYAVGQKTHLALELLPEQLEGWWAALLETFIQVCIGLFALAVMVWGGGRLVYVQLMLGQTSPALDVPLGVVYAVVPISGLLMLFYAVVHVATEECAPGPSADETEQHQAVDMGESDMGESDTLETGADDTPPDGYDQKALPID